MPQDFRDSHGPTWSVIDDWEDYTSEHDLFESIIVEQNDIFGAPADFYLLEFNYADADRIYGEDQNEFFRGPFRTKISYQPPTEMMDIVNQFGITSGDLIETANIPIYTYSRDVSASREPMAGDLVHILWTDRVYAITDQDEELDTFQLKKFSYNLNLRPHKLTNVDTEVVVDDLTNALPLSAWGDNVQIETESDTVDDYSDLPDIEDIYGYS